jgi:hypothetical protein
VVLTLFFAGVLAPSAFFVVAGLAAAALGLRVIAPAFPSVVEASAARTGRPYRTNGGDMPPPVRPTVADGSPTVGSSERARALAGALFATYLAAWTLSWTAGPWPAHVVALDVALTVVIAIVVGRTRVRSAGTPLLASYGHWLLAAGVVRMPQSTVACGETAVALGFALLAGALVASYRLRAQR